MVLIQFFPEELTEIRKKKLLSPMAANYLEDKQIKYENTHVDAIYLCIQPNCGAKSPWLW